MTEFHIAQAGILQLHAEYIDAAFRRDYDAFGDCFMEDAEWRIRGHVNRGRQGCVDFFKRTMENSHMLLVTLRPPALKVGNGTAEGRTYFTAQNLLKDGTPLCPIGRYFERFVDCGDRWRFKWRLFQTHYAGPPDLSGERIKCPDYGSFPNMPPLDAPG
jgi:hypothetical protein